METDLIYDVGLNNGDDTAYYLRKGYRVVGIDAHPGLVEKVAERFRREVADGRLTILNAAISEHEGEHPFWLCDSNPEWSSFDRDIASRNGALHHQVTVRGRPFGSILEEFGVPYYLKIDIEGSDYLCIRALRAHDSPAYLSIEQSGTVRKNLEAFRSLRYSKFKCISQFHFLPLQPEPTEEELRYGKYWRRLTTSSMVWRIARRLGARRSLWGKLNELRSRDGWIFPFGSSGPFGEDTLGRWLSYDELLDMLETVTAQFERGEPSLFWGPERHSFWADYHMKREDVE